MSYSIYFNSFDPKTADEKWDNFDSVVKEALEIDGKVKELNEKLDGLDEYEISDEEIYNPDLKEKAAARVAKIRDEETKVRQELQELEGKYSGSGAILDSIKDQEPVDPDLDYLIYLDLDFGGHNAGFSSSCDPMAAIPATLGILFPEVGNSGSIGDLDREDFIFLADHFDELKERYQIHKSELLEDNDVEVGNEDQLWEWMVDFRNYMKPMRKVAIDIAQKGAKLYVWSDSDGRPDDELLEARAEEHVARFKDHPMMKIPLQNYGK